MENSGNKKYDVRNKNKFLNLTSYFLPLNQRAQRGFTLLLAALVASIVVAIGAAIYSITIKELNLSATGRDSQFAFYAADTSAECALYNDINLQIFSTTTPPTSISCDGATTTVGWVANATQNNGGQMSYTIPGSYTFTTPAQFNSLTVTVNGAGGGGGGGANVGFTSGSNGANGTASSWNGAVVGNAGTGGQGGRLSGATGTTGTAGTASGGDTNSSGAGSSGGSGGFGTIAGDGGAGGAGGQAFRTYTSSQIGMGVPIAVVVGIGGSGGSPGGGGARPGSNGTGGLVSITWQGTAPAWNSTTFSFLTQPNGVCAITYLTKTIINGAIRNLIHSDGSNVPCSATTTSPRALQRSVEINY